MGAGEAPLSFPDARFSARERSCRSAFTLIEVLIVVALISILSLVSILLLSGKLNSSNLQGARAQIVATLREAESRSVADDQGTAWGVHFMNATATAPFYALFYASYSASTTSAYYRLPPGIAYVTSTLALGTSTDVIFSQISGTSSVSTSIGLVDTAQRSLSSTISVSGSGLVSF